MKKLISTLCSLLILTSFPLSNVYAEGNPDLQSLASSLGADTDHFSFKNYRGASISDEMLSVFKQKITPTEAMLNRPEKAVVSSKGGECNAMAILEILVHNGIISASDIQEGADFLCDITFDDKINDILTYYQMTQVFQKQYLAIRNYWCNHDVSDAISDLVKYGNRAVEEGEYFYISFSWDKGAHAVVGIGETDGSWEFNGRKYNKCILTLDSSFDSFTEKACIYVNTEENTFYFPAYDYTENDAQITMITGDETLLNYKGLLSPSYSSDTNTDDLTEIEIGNYKFVNNKSVGSDIEFYITDDNGTRTYTSKGFEPLDITKNYFINMIETNKQYTFPAAKNTKYKLKINETSDAPEADSVEAELFQITENCFRYCYSEGFDKNTEIEFGEHYMSRYVPNYSSFSFNLLSEDTPYKNEEFNMYRVLGNNIGTIAMHDRNDGILLTTDQKFDAFVSFEGLIKNDDGSIEAFKKSADQHVIYCTLSSVNNIMLRYNDSDDRIAIFIDNNNDDVYDKELEKGDANCDGIIDARDASLILSAYARQSVNERPYSEVNEYYCDLDGNGIIDARDATSVLSYYAKSSVNS